ncbi:MAG: hypothetical protein KAS59_08585 [Alphaproteobacteria bacterium]|nr:hypothetical protein [Alphaproteobacteria bacterium]
MIDPNAYTSNSALMTGSSMSGYPPISLQKNDPDAAAEANFERILENSAPTSTHSTAEPETLETNEFSFLDLFKTVIDIFNPLQHLPVIGAIYRHITGDEISPISRLAGNTLYGGHIGGAVAIADIICEKTTGKDIGENLIAGLTNGNTPPDTVIAEKTDEHKAIATNEIIWSTIQTQEFPEKNIPVPTDIIASKMMEALDKYTQINRPFVIPQNSEIY